MGLAGGVGAVVAVLIPPIGAIGAAAGAGGGVRGAGAGVGGGGARGAEVEGSGGTGLESVAAFGSVTVALTMPPIGLAEEGKIREVSGASAA